MSDGLSSMLGAAQKAREAVTLTTAPRGKRRFKFPSGKIYEFPENVTQAQIDQTYLYDSQFGVPPSPMGAATAQRVGLSQAPPKRDMRNVATGIGVADPKARTVSAEELEEEILQKLSDSELQSLLGKTYGSGKDQSEVRRRFSGRMPEIRARLMTEKRRRVAPGIASERVPPGIRQAAAFLFNLPEEIRSSVANIADPEATSLERTLGVADVVPIPIAGEIVKLSFKGLGKLGTKTINALKGRKFASVQDVERFLNAQGLSRSQVTMVLGQEQPKVGIGGIAGVGPTPGIADTRRAAPSLIQRPGTTPKPPPIVKPDVVSEPKKVLKLGGVSDELAEQIEREKFYIRNQNPDMPDAEVNRLAQIYAKKKIERKTTGAGKVSQAQGGSKTQGPLGKEGGGVRSENLQQPTGAGPEAGRSRIPQTPEEVESVTGLRMVDIESASRKLGITLPDKKLFREHWSEVEARSMADFDRISQNLGKVDIEKNPALTRDEHFVGRIEIERLGGEINGLSEKLVRADGSEKQALQDLLDAKLSQAERLSKMLYRSNSEHGRNLAFLRYTLEGPFDSASLIQKAERIAGGNLNSKVRLTITNAAERGKRTKLTIEEKMRNDAEKALKSILETKPKITAKGIKLC